MYIRNVRPCDVVWILLAASLTIYIQGEGFILVFRSGSYLAPSLALWLLLIPPFNSLTSRDSLDELRNLHEQIMRVKDPMTGRGVPFVLVGSESISRPQNLD